MQALPKIQACCRVSIRELEIFRLWIQHYMPHVNYLAALIVSEPGDDTATLEQHCLETNVRYKVWRAQRYHPGTSMTALRQLVSEIETDWVVHADSDEFLFEVGELGPIVSAMEMERAEFSIAWMADRLAFGGRLAAIDHLGTVAELEAAFPVRAAVTQDVARGDPYKVCVCRWPSVGAIHGPDPGQHRKASRRLTLEHFKWRDGLMTRLQKRIADHTASKLPWANESRRLIDELSTYGRIRTERCLASRSRRIAGPSHHEGPYLNWVTRAPTGAHVVEVGLGQGRSLCYLAEAAIAADKHLTIDGHDRCDDSERSSLDSIISNLRAQGMLQYVNVREALSPGAANLYAANSIDSVWMNVLIDSDTALAEAEKWWPKVKLGGEIGLCISKQVKIAALLEALTAPNSRVSETDEWIIARKLPLSQSC